MAMNLRQLLEHVDPAQTLYRNCRVEESLRGYETSA